MNLSIKEINEALETLGALLEDQGLKFELVAIGGSCLMLLGFIARPTKDIGVANSRKMGRYA